MVNVETTEYQEWYEVDSGNGREWIAVKDVPAFDLSAWERENPIPTNGDGRRAVPAQLMHFVECMAVYGISLVSGWGMRLSEVNGMNCEPWTVYEYEANEREEFLSAVRREKELLFADVENLEEDASIQRQEDRQEQAERDYRNFYLNEDGEDGEDEGSWNNGPDEWVD